MTPQPATQWRTMSETPDKWPVWMWHPVNGVGLCPIYDIDSLKRIASGGYTHWHYLEVPAPPQRELSAFEEWLARPYLANARDCWDAATKAERARFSEGVEKLLRKYDGDHDYLISHLRFDLRALAAGNGEGSQ